MPGSRRAQRQRAAAELRAQGRYGPELREVLPAFAGLGLAVAAPLALLLWLYLRLGVLGLVLGVVALAAAAAAALRWRRTAVRRRGGIYTAAELATLNDRGLATAAGRMLTRDGWRVIDVPNDGRPRLYAVDRGGRQLDVTFRPVNEAVPDELQSAEETATGPAPLREVGRPGVDHLIRVVVSKGAFSRADVLWASRQGGVHLLDGRQLQQWATGTPLDDLSLPR